MNKVITIHLAGRAYVLEESGYAALRAYLDEAAQKLEGNPDKEEILKDFDVAVAEKCETYLHSGKNVITTSEVEKIIQEMGPVENSDKKHEAQQENNQQKKLYRIRERSLISGVCTGLAIYFDIDLLLVRIIFVLLAGLTHGVWIFVYLLLIMIIPVAETPEEKSHAFGTTPMSAHSFFENAKNGYSNFKTSKEWQRWKHQMKEETKIWKKRWKYNHHQTAYTTNRPSPFYELMQSIMGLIWIAFLLFVLWFAYNHVGPVHQFFDSLGMLWQRVMETIAQKIGY